MVGTPKRQQEIEVKVEGVTCKEMEGKAKVTHLHLKKIHLKATKTKKTQMTKTNRLMMRVKEEMMFETKR